MSANACVICQTVTSKYRCPNCFDRYCSVACCKAHKESCVKQKNDSKVDESAHILQAQEKHPFTRDNNLVVRSKVEEDNNNDWVPDALLQQLEQSPELKESLSNPHLRAMLEKLINIDKPEEAITQAMHEPIFTEFADICLQIVDKDSPRVEQSANV